VCCGDKRTGSTKNEPLIIDVGNEIARNTTRWDRKKNGKKGEGYGWEKVTQFKREHRKARGSALLTGGRVTEA